MLRGRRAGPWEPPAHLEHRRVAFEGNTGARLAGVWYPARESRGAVVLAHPDKRYAKHWFVREGWVDFLHRHQLDVLTFDFTGYGESEGPSTYYHEDVFAAARLARERTSGERLAVVGVSMGAFATANASPRLDFADALVLESPYPSFRAWYGDRPGRFAIRAFDALFPRTATSIHADRNIRGAAAKRVLVAYAREDEVTPAHLSEAVAKAAPPERTRTMVVDGVAHLGLFAGSAPYREAVLETILGVAPQTPILPSP